jgi:hypothetical protein
MVQLCSIGLTLPYLGDYYGSCGGYEWYPVFVFIYILKKNLLFITEYYCVFSGWGVVGGKTPPPPEIPKFYQS